MRRIGIPLLTLVMGLILGASFVLEYAANHEASTLAGLSTQLKNSDAALTAANGLIEQCRAEIVSQEQTLIELRSERDQSAQQYEQLTNQIQIAAAEMRKQQQLAAQSNPPIVPVQAAILKMLEDFLR